MAGSTTYPGSVDNKTALQDGIDIIQADDVNDAYVPIDAIQTFVGTIGSGKNQSSTTDILDALCNKKGPNCKKASASSITVEAAALAIKNSGQTIRMLRRNSADLTLTAAHLDTGSMAVGWYDIYGLADSVATTWTGKFCVSGNTPNGATNYELIGWFYNETAGVLDVTSGFIGNWLGGGRSVPNWVYLSSTNDITLNDTAYGTDLDAILVRFRSSGRPVQLIANIALSSAGANPNLTQFIVNLDGSDVAATETNARNTAGADDFSSPVVLYDGTPSAGTHTFKIRGKVVNNSIVVTNWGISVKEL